MTTRNRKFLPLGAGWIEVLQVVGQHDGYKLSQQSGIYQQHLPGKIHGHYMTSHSGQTVITNKITHHSIVKN